MERLQPSDAEYLERLLKQFDARTVSQRIDADMAFHGYLYELSGFALLQGLWPQMEVLTRKFVSMSRRISSAETTRENHRAILTALTTRDAQAVDRAVEAHMHQTAAVLEGRPRQDPVDAPLNQAPRR
jgi:DNA-binding GntR family transcriptional regulator